MKSHIEKAADAGSKQMQDLNRELGPRVQAPDLYVLLPLAIVN